MTRGDASEFFTLARELGEVPAKTLPVLMKSMTDGGKVVERSWKNRAAQTHTSHAMFFSESIETEVTAVLGGVTVDIGPVVESGTGNQGFLGRVLEFGGSHSPAYMHGHKALTENEGQIERAIDQSINPLFP